MKNRRDYGRYNDWMGWLLLCLFAFSSVASFAAGDFWTGGLAAGAALLTSLTVRRLRP